MAAMASLTSSCSVFLEGGDALGVRGAADNSVQRRESGMVVRCDARAKGDVDRSDVRVVLSRRQAACAFVAAALVWPVAPRAWALLEADDDDSLLEKVKEDKKKRIQKRSTAINNFVKESGMMLLHL